MLVVFAGGALGRQLGLDRTLGVMLFVTGLAKEKDLGWYPFAALPWDAFCHITLQSKAFA